MIDSVRRVSGTVDVSVLTLCGVELRRLRAHRLNLPAACPFGLRGTPTHGYNTGNNVQGPPFLVPSSNREPISGDAPTLDEAKAEFRENWSKAKAR